MHSNGSRIALGFLALFVGGAFGGMLIGGWRTTPVAQREADPVSSAPVSALGDSALTRAIEELASEVRSLRSATPAGSSSQRVRIGEPEKDASDSKELIAALDRLTDALQSSKGRGSSGGIGITPLVLPSGGKRMDAFEALRSLDEKELSGAHRFSTYQQVLDLFGPPDTASKEGYWLYFLDTTEGKQIAFFFEFVDGYLVKIRH